ncbi:hypothetical protein WJX74_001082 [Apatococcus lobatus]|uniref:Actin-related protein 4 n=2 Tax=Apatococcus TaxID=904362 RepID=A0AAW1TD17_9CHLO
MYGGDETNGVVVDCGSSTTRAGYAGEDTPEALFPSVVGFSTADAEGQARPETSNKRQKTSATIPSTRKLRAGNAQLDYRHEGFEVEPVFQYGNFTSIEAVEALWEHAWRDRLRVNIEEHPVMMAEPVFQTKAAREQLLEALFETHKAPAAFMAKSAVLASYAMGRQTSLMVDAGHNGTVVAAVHDGFVLKHSITQSCIGGSALSQCMLKSVEAKNISVKPRFAFKRQETSPGHFEVQDVGLKGLTDSFCKFHVQQIAADIKESIGRVSDLPFSASENANIPTVNYELPDGNEIQIGPERFNVPEVLLQPSLLQSTFAGVVDTAAAQGASPASLLDVIQDSISRSDVDVRRELYNSILLTGGCSLFATLRDRLERELADAAPQTAKVKVTSPANATERRFAVWIGGSILASLGSFQQMWMSKKEYEEHGAALMHRKAP